MNSTLFLLSYSTLSRYLEFEFPEGTFSLLLTRNENDCSRKPPQMIVSPIGDVTITNDGATILKEIESTQ